MINIENLSNETKNAYLACAIDSEGCISIRKNSHGERFRLSGTIGISNTSLDFLSVLASMSGQPFNLSKNGRVGVKKSNGIISRKQAYQVTWRSPRHIIPILEKIIPYLVIKKDRALALQEFILSRMSHENMRGVKGVYTEKELQLCDMVTIMNGKSKKFVSGDTTA